MMNGSINMRTIIYSNPLLFWITALMLIISLWNICRFLVDKKLLRRSYVLDEIKSIGSNSIIYIYLIQFYFNAIRNYSFKRKKCLIK